eukprot:2062906-Rhodomonas_salina.1
MGGGGQREREKRVRECERARGSRGGHEGVTRGSQGGHKGVTRGHEGSQGGHNGYILVQSVCTGVGGVVPRVGTEFVLVGRCGTEGHQVFERHLCEPSGQHVAINGRNSTTLLKSNTSNRNLSACCTRNVGVFGGGSQRWQLRAPP